jgi:hypothetical protein
MSKFAKKHENRLRRQFKALARSTPAARRPLEALLHERMRLVRVPLAILLIICSFLAILPVFGLWMLPAGLMLLAVDMPRLRPRVSAALIRVRRWWAVRRHKRKPIRTPQRVG